MFGFLSKKRSDTAVQLSSMSSALKRAFNTVKEELDDHRESINDNSNEIAANYEVLTALDAKIDKLTERFDSMQLLIENMAGQAIEKTSIELSKVEQRIFLLLYTMTEQLNYKQIAERVAITEIEVTEALGNLIDKGVSIVQEFRNKTPFVRLGRDFRDYQAKNNVVRIDTELLVEMKQ